jgi:molecular chaperone DnaK (HSP70)
MTANAKPDTAVFGIDLGTTNTCVAQLLEGQRQPEALENVAGDRTTPSVVYFEPGGRIVVGKEARNIARAMPQLVCAHIKREMGTEEKKTYHGEEYTPAAVSALILKKVVGEALEGLGRERSDKVKAVITVPANYPTEAKHATLQAGVLAGVDVLYLAQEPVAAAFGYSFGRLRRPENLLVYDLGGGTFDVTVVRSDGTSAHTVATAGEQQCGGLNWDEVVVDWLRQRFEDEHPGNRLPVDDPEVSQMLFERAEQAKHALSEHEKTTITVAHGGNTITPVLTQGDFEKMTAHLLERTLVKTREVRDEAGKRGVHIDKVLLVGGSSRMAAVKRALHDTLGIEPLLHQPDLAIAKGAAILARMIEAGEFQPDTTGKAEAEPSKNSLVTMVNPKSLGLQVTDPNTGKDHVCYLIQRNEPLPASHTETFGVHVDNQETADLRVLEERAEPSPETEENTLLHSTPIDLPPGLRKGSPLEITFRLDSAGFVHIFVKEPKSNRTWEVEVERYKKVTEAEVRHLKPKMDKVA